jgi:hypothetical protein
MTMPAKEPIDARPAPDLLLEAAVAEERADEALELPDPDPDPDPLPSVKPVAVAWADAPDAAVELPDAEPMKEEVRVQLQDELKYADE